MNHPLRRKLLTYLGGSVFLLSASMVVAKNVAPAASSKTGVPGPSTTLIEGGNYQVLKVPQPVSVPKKVEVLEFFWYGCPYCYHFEPFFEGWRRKQKLDVLVRKVPVSFGAGGRSEPHQRLFYTIETIGKPNLHDKIFEAIQKERKMLLTPEEMVQYLAQFGVNPKMFMDTYNSFAVKNKVAQATKMETDYQITGVPTVAVQGRYITSPSMAAGAKETLRVMDALVAKAKSELK